MEKLDPSWEWDEDIDIEDRDEFNRNFAPHEVLFFVDDRYVPGHAWQTMTPMITIEICSEAYFLAENCIDDRPTNGAYDVLEDNGFSEMSENTFEHDTMQDVKHKKAVHAQMLKLGFKQSPAFDQFCKAHN